MVWVIYFISMYDFSSKNCAQRLAICSGWLLKPYLSTVTKRNSEDKRFYQHITQPLQIAAVAGCTKKEGGLLFLSPPLS